MGSDPMLLDYSKKRKCPDEEFVATKRARTRGVILEVRGPRKALDSIGRVKRIPKAQKGRKV